MTLIKNCNLSKFNSKIVFVAFIFVCIASVFTMTVVASSSQVTVIYGNSLPPATRIIQFSVNFGSNVRPIDSGCLNATSACDFSNRQITKIYLIED